MKLNTALSKEEAAIKTKFLELHGYNSLIEDPGKQRKSHTSDCLLVNVSGCTMASSYILSEHGCMIGYFLHMPLLSHWSKPVHGL